MNQFKTLIVGILLIAVLVIALLLKIGGKDIDLLKVKTTEVFKPAVIYDMGGKFDKSFNEGVYNGIKRFTDETGIAVMEFEVTNEAQRQQAMEKMIQRGATLVLGVGFAQADAIDKVAAANPDKMF